MCKGDRLYPYLNLGFQPPADEFLRKDQLHYPRNYYPLEVMMCRSCGLSQLSYVVSPEILYRHDYPYEASVTRTGREHFAKFAREVVARFGLGGEDLVVDVGSNVGVLLSNFKANGTSILGIDPASNIVRIAEANEVPTVNELFSAELASHIRSEKGPVSLITATNCFAHVDNLDDFMAGVRTMLTPKGVLIVEAPHFLTMIKNLEYDTIYHEHLSYLSLKAMAPYLAGFGMEPFDVQKQFIHGGSFRVFFGRKGKHRVMPAVRKCLAEEQRAGLSSKKVLDRFARRVRKNRMEIRWLLHRLKRQGKRIAAVSAPAKGMTLLNYCGIGTELVDFVTEKSKLKLGRYTPGGHIPILPDSALVERKPHYALLLAWNFSKEIMANLKDYRRRGGKFILPIPKPRIVS